MKQYLDLLRAIKARGTRRGDRTGTGTIDLFGYQMRIDLAEGFPLLTTKKVNMRSVIYELLWILNGETNIKYLVDNGVHIWTEWPFVIYLKRNNLPIPPQNSDEWKKGIADFSDKIRADDAFAKRWGDLGPLYGAQWREWRAIDTAPRIPGVLDEDDIPARLTIRRVDQMSNVVEAIKKDPESRRHIVVAWNPGEIGKMLLPPCHMMFQFHVADGKLSCQLYQRSADVFLGVPFNIASYSLLTMMVAQVCGLEPGEFIHTFGSVHIYLNHQEQVDLQLSREPRPLPMVRLNPAAKDLFRFRYEDFTVENYNPHAFIKGEVAV